MSISPTVIIPLQTPLESTFQVRTLLDSGSGTNWIVKSLLKHVRHTKRGSEVMEVYTFHGAVRKSYPRVEVYYKDQENHIHSIMCFVHDSYIRHIQLKMADYILGERQNCRPFSLPGPLSDPGDPNVGHGYESQGIGLVLCSASTNKIRTPDPIINIKELDILLEPTIFGVVISGAIPDHLRSTADRVSVNCTLPQIVQEVSSLQTSKKQTTPEHNFSNSADENLTTSCQDVDCTIGFILLMFIFRLMATSPTELLFYILAALGNISSILVTKDLFQFESKVGIKTSRSHYRNTKKGEVHTQISAAEADNKTNKFYTKVSHLVIGHRHRPRLKCLSIYLDSHTGEKTNYQNLNKSVKCFTKDLLPS